jgi:type VI secretion system protein ImpL
MGGYDEEFELLQERLYQRLLERVHKEPDIDRRSLIFSFPTQMAALKQVSQEFLDQIFARPATKTARAARRLLHEWHPGSTPIDRLMGVMASTFGLDRKRLSAFSGAGRSYFLTRLLAKWCSGKPASSAATAASSGYVSSSDGPRCRWLWWS